MWISVNRCNFFVKLNGTFLHHMQCDGAFRLCKKGLVKFTPGKGSISPNIVHQAKRNCIWQKTPFNFIYIISASIVCLFLCARFVRHSPNVMHAPINNSHLLRFAKKCWWNLLLGQMWTEWVSSTVTTDILTLFFMTFFGGSRVWRNQF